jgi:phosphohistidine phosphatase
MTDRVLVLLRHAKAEHPAKLADVDRPLTPRGHADSGAAGAWLASQGLVPHLVLCSPSRRTRDTWHSVKLALGVRTKPVFDPRLYDGTVAEMVELISETASNVDTVLVIGHNPALSMLSALLDPAGGPPDGLRTCGLAVHRMTGAWSGASQGEAPLVTVHTARA